MDRIAPWKRLTPILASRFSENDIESFSAKTLVGVKDKDYILHRLGGPCWHSLENPV